MGSDSLKTRARRLADLKAEMARTQKIADAAEKQYREAERDFWLDLEEEGIKTTSFDFDDGSTIQVQRRETITSTILDKEAAVQSLVELGYGDELLGQPEIRKKVLNEVVRNLLQAGEGLPEGVDFNPRRYITVTKKGN